MKREELEHVIRAAADISGEDEIVIVGSQAILGRFPDAPQSLLYSQEADVFPRRNPALSEAIDSKRAGSSSQATGWCLEPHDLVLSKCVAGRERDLDFAATALEHDLVDLGTLLERISDLSVGEADRRRTEAAVRGIAGRLGR